MEDFNFIDAIVGVIIVGIPVAIGFLVKFINKRVDESETKVDDRIRDAVVKALRDELQPPA